MRFAIVVSEFNADINDGLLAGALELFAEQKVKVKKEDVFRAPGAFELPLLAKKLAKKKTYDGVVCLGCVIKGDTMHFEFISLASAMGILQAGLETEKPVAFGVLTTLDEEQARVRSLPGPENKGREAAAACLSAARALKSMR